MGLLAQDGLSGIREKSTIMLEFTHIRALHFELAILIMSQETDGAGW